MRRFMLVLVVVAAAGAFAYIGAGFLPGPSIRFVRPARFVGAATPVEIALEAPGGLLSMVDLFFEQRGVLTPVASLGAGNAEVSPVGNDSVTFAAEFTRDRVTGLQSGPARLVVRASRPVLFGLRDVTTDAIQDVEVRLEPPRLSVLSMHHYVNLGGAEMVLYRVEPSGAQSGVRVGDLEYPGYPASGISVPGVSLSDPALRVAFFALLWNQALDTPIRLFAKDEAGNSAEVPFETRAFRKPFKTSRISLDDRFLGRVVPAILAGTDDVRPSGSLLEQFLVINGELRQRNAEKIRSFARETAPNMLWGGAVFHPFTNSAVESAFADQRTYLYEGREVDRQVHLGFDLASYAGTPILAANRGRVLFADELGIYGRCVILDHGMGVQSLYAHLSSIEVQPGAMVEKEQPLGRSGMTGLAGGDHLHFTMLVNGQMVNPLEWWDAHWIEDRVLRKLRATP